MKSFIATYYKTSAKALKRAKELNRAGLEGDFKPPEAPLRRIYPKNDINPIRQSFCVLEAKNGYFVISNRQAHEAGVK